MNKVYNVIWSSALNALVVVAEGTKSRSKSTVRGLRVLVAFLLLSPASGMSATLPQGGVISIGEGTIVNSGTGQMTIKQSTDKLGINWQSFNVGADGQVIFDQPSRNSVALNRVIGSDASSILGRIDANGQVFLINPNGVIFGKDSKVNVGGLVASTLDISDEDFKNGHYQFDADAGNGEIINNGTLQAAEGGYVAVLGKSVKNNGLIKAQLGSAALAAGDAVTLDFSGDGLINVQVDKGSVKALVENKGIIQADGGSVLMTARATNALMDTVVNNAGVIQAQTINNLNGKITLDGGPKDGTGIVLIGGTLDASAPATGNGGYIDTSGRNVIISKDVRVTTLSSEGLTGQWKIDPSDFSVNAGDGAQTINSIGAATLSNALLSTNVSLATSDTDSLGEAGDINVNAAVAWNADTKLTLTAHNDININDRISVDGASGALDLNYGGRVNVKTGASVKLNGASTTYSENGSNFEILRTANDLKVFSSAAATSRKFALGGDIDASEMSAWDEGKGFASYGNLDDNNEAIYYMTLNGLGNTISDFYVNRPDQAFVGLLGAVSGSTISNVNITGTAIGGDRTGLLIGEMFNSNAHNLNATGGSVTGGKWVGGLVGYAYTDSVLENLSSGVNVAGTGDSVGGALGYSDRNLLIKNIHGYGTVSGHEFAGGAVGSSFGDAAISDISSGATSVVSGDITTGSAIGAFSGSLAVLTNVSGSGTVTGGSSVGGALGYAAGSLLNIKSDAKVTGATSVGGLIGELQNSTVDESFATGDVTGTTNMAGGLIGASYNSTISNSLSTGRVTGASNTGGFVGQSSNDTINTSFTTSNVSGTENVGGFVGTTSGSKISNVYATGEVNSSLYYSGGFAGVSWNSIITNAYSTGKVSSTGTVNGGAMGASSGDTLTNLYWDVDKSGYSTSAGGIGLTTAQFHDADTFADWGVSTNGDADSNLWRIYEGQTAPLLKFLMGTANAQQQDINSTYTGYAQTPIIPSDMNTVTNVVSNNFFSSLLDLTAAGLQGGDFAGNSSMVNAGSYTATSPLYSSQFGLNITQDNVGKFVIGKATLGFTATGKDKVYDGTTGADASLVANGLGSDSLTVGGFNASFSDKNAGSGKKVTIQGITVSGSAVDNYTWESVLAVANITKAELTVSAVGNDKVYDASTVATVGLSDNRIAGDDIIATSSSATYTDKNAGISKEISVAGINLTGADAGNYTWNETALATAEIAKASLLITADASSKAYDSNTVATVSLGDNRISGDSLILGMSQANFADKNAGLNKTVSINGITVTGADAGNYEWNESATAVADIGRVRLGITATGVDKTYDGTKAATIELTDTRLGADDLTVSSGSSTFTDKNADVDKQISVSGITVTGADAANYFWDSTAVATADINKAVLDVTAVAADKTYDGSTSVSAALSDNRVLSDSLVISGSSKFVDKNAGANKAVIVYDIQVTGQDAQNYTWNDTALTTATIGKAQLDITLGAASKDYDSTTHADAFLSDNRVAGDSLTLSHASANFEDKNAGTGKTVTVDGITVTGADAGNYMWTTSGTTTADIGRAALNITATGVNKTYDGTTDASSVFTDNRLGSDDLTVTADTIAFVDKSAASGKQISISGITVTGDDAGNYIWDATAISTADITKAHLDISANAAGKTYDGTTAVSAALSDNRIAGDNLVITSSNAFADKNAGADKTVHIDSISVTGADALNYEWDSATTTTATIDKAQLQIDATASNKTYDGNTSASTILSDNRISGDDLLVSSTSSSFSDKNAGSNKTVTVGGISISGADADNYDWNALATAQADITKANLVITAAAQNKVYDGSSLVSTSLSDNRVGSDDLVITSTDSSFSDKNAADGKTVTVNGIGVTGADAANYNWSSTATTNANIAKANLSVTATASDKIYDGSSNASTVLADNRIGADDLIINKASSSFSDKNAAADKVVTVGGISVSGADAQNYTWNTVATTIADIAKAQLDITIGAASKDYDTTTNADVFLNDNRVSGDSLAFTHDQAFFDDKNAGSGKTVTVQDIGLSGADAGNYVWNTSATTTADIGRAVLAITATGVNKTYDGTTDASTTFSDNRLGSDDLSISADTVSFIDKNADTGKQISISGITVTGADASNYIWDATGLATADIAKATLNVTATAANKTYDGNTGVSTTIADNRIGADDLVISSNSAFADKNAGVGKTVNVNSISVTGADAGNYIWNTETATTADISKAQLVVTAGAASKDYDSTTHADAFLSDNRITGDNLQLNYGQASFADKNAGTAKAVSVEGIAVTGLDAGNYEWNTRGDTTADIGRAVLTINATGVNKTYDGTTSANAIYTDNRLGSDSLTITADDATFIDKNAGAGKQISISGLTVSGADAANYIWDATSVTTADITKANLVVNATASDKIYNGSAVASTYLGDNRIGSDVINLSSSSSTFSDKNAGEDKVVTVSGITVSGADAQNYNWNTVATTNADIAKAQLDVTAGASSKDYDSTRNASVVLNDNRISGDSLSISSSQALFDTKDAGLGKNVAIGGISVTGADAGNYMWNTATTATADIGKAILSITAAGVNKTYDGTTDGSVVLSDNRLGSDSLTIGASDVQFIDKNADTGKQMSVSGITVSGADALNYIWDASTVATADINKAALNVNALASDKVYDGNTSVITTLTDNRILGDNLVITSSPSSFADKNAGAGKTVSVGGIDVSGTDALNYTWNTDTSTTANIAKANLVVDATGVNKTYDSTTASSATLSDNRISGDSLSLSYDSAAFADKNAGTGKAISVNGINVTGADAGNYIWNTTDAASGNIDKASLVITASGVDKTYDGTKAGSVVLSDSRFANDDLLLSAGTIAFADKNAGADKAISVGGINVTGADAQNYTWNASALTSADIAKAALTIGATAQDKVYDTTTSALIGLTDNRVSGDVLSITGSGVFSDKNAGNGKSVSVSGITVTGADAGNYTWNTLAVAVADISKANLVISAVAADKTYDGTTTALSSLSDNRLAGDDLVLTSTSTNFSDKNAGIAKAVTVSGISVTGSDAANYSWSNTASSTATINKAVLTVSGAAADKTYDGSVTATANLSDNRIGSDVLDVSAGSVKFSDKNAGLDKVVSIDGIAVAGADASNYTWNTTATSTADIAKATLSVIATAQDKVYDGASTATTTLSDNRVAGDNLVVNTTGSAFSDKNAGVGKLVTISGITLSGADALNYVTSNAATTTATINKAALSVVADAADKTYNGSTGTTATLSDNRVAGDVLSLGYGDASFSDKNAGTNKSVSVSGISISGADAMNYTWNTTATDTASIAKANLAIVASGESKVYDGTASASVNLADNRVAGDQLTLSATDAQFADKNAGFGKSVAVSGMTVSGADAGNYVWNTTATTQADISKRALQVSGVGVSKTYDGTTATSASLVDDRILGDNLAVTSSGAAFADKNAGSGKTIFIEGLDVAGADANNYTWSSTATAAADISKAQLTVIATAADKVYNGNTAALSTYSDDRLAGDALTVNAASSTFSDKNAGTGKTVTVNGISLSGADAQNYTVNSVAVATANISKAALIVGANGVTKVYDGSTDAQISLTDNRVAGDDLIVANAIAKYGDKNAGANKAVDVDGITVSGVDSENYTWNTSTTTQGNIEKANLTISGVVQDKIYDGSTQATLGALTDNRIAGDSLTISAAGASFTDKNAGANKAATINGVMVTGSDADNYNWNSISITAAEITKAFLQLAAAGQNKVYDGTTKANVSVSDNRISGDQVAVTVGSAQFDDKNAGTGKEITATGLSLAGADAGNYSISNTLTARADVARADLNISANQITKVKGSQDPSLTWKLSDGDLFAGDALTGSLERVSGEELGTYAVEQGTLSAGGNYNLAFTSGALTITDTPQQAPNGLDNVVSAIKTGSVDMPTLKQGQIVVKSLGYNMLNLGIKLPETLLDGLASNSQEVEILK